MVCTIMVCNIPYFAMVVCQVFSRHLFSITAGNDVIHKPASFKSDTMQFPTTFYWPTVCKKIFVPLPEIFIKLFVQNDAELPWSKKVEISTILWQSLQSCSSAPVRPLVCTTTRALPTAVAVSVTA